MGYEITVMTNMAIYAILALGLNLISGYCGQISLGHAAFYGVGGYTAALVTTAGGSFFLALPAAAVMAAIFGIVVGLASLRVQQDFLAITTMGAGFLFVGFVRKQDWLGGELGISSIPDPGLGQLGFLLLAAGIAGLLLAFSLYIKRSWMGFAFDAVAGDEATAATLGIDAARYKIAAFALGTAFAGLAGALYAHFTRFIVPDSFGFIESITVLAMVVVGGIGSNAGVLAGVVILTLLPEAFRFVNDYKLLLYGALLFAVMRFSPGGLAGLVRSLTARLAQREML